MGFSVSGSAAIVFAGLFIAFGMFHSAATDSFERVSDAQQDQTNENVDQRNTAIDITSTSYDSGTGTLTVDVENTGATALSLNETDVIVDNTYETNWQDGATVGGNAETDLLLPEETVTITISIGSQPDRVKVVTQHGVADTEVV